MNDVADNFEAFLRDALKDAAKDAPGAPGAFTLRQTLRRRTMTRVGWIAAAAVVAFATALLFAPMLDGRASSVQTAVDYWRGVIFRPGATKPETGEKFMGPPAGTVTSGPGTDELLPVPIVPVIPPVTPEPMTPEPQNTLVAALAPLDGNADMFALRAKMTVYFRAHGIERVEITKEPGEELDYLLRADGVIDFAQVSFDMQSLLKNYSRARLSLKNGDLTCWLLAPARNEQ